MINFLISIVGYTMIYIACDVNRKEDSKIKIFTKGWWIQLTLVTIGVIIIKNQW
jgi:hypothetical protein